MPARMNADLHMADDLKNTGKGNLFVIGTLVSPPSPR
jgi:adenine-specific DNA-methyltransferase